MSRYTVVWSDVWNDDEVFELSTEGKLLYLYLLTSPVSNQAGYYKLSIKQIINDTGLDLDTVKSQLIGQTKLWKYDEHTKQVLIPNYLKYNRIGGTKAIMGLNAQVLPLAKCELTIDFLFAVNKYLGEQALTVFDKSLITYIKVFAEQNPANRKAAVLLSKSIY